MPEDLIQINDSIWIEKYEVTIRDYFYFLVDSNNLQQLNNNLPNPSEINWYDGVNNHYYIYQTTDTNLGFDVNLWYTPIVNITKQNAITFCQWRTKLWEKWHLSLTKSQKKKYPKKVIFRLPTQQEWINAAAANLDTTKLQFGVKNKKKLNVISLEYFSKKELEKGKLKPTGAADPWRFGIKNKFGIYNMCGDVAEFVSNSNLVFGGSFKDSLKYCKINSSHNYEKPSDWIGFRCVAEIKN